MENKRVTEEIKFNVLTEICSFLNSSLPEDEQLRAIVEAAKTLLQVSNSSLILVDESIQGLRVHVTTGESPQRLSEMRLEVGESIAGWVVQHGDPVVVPDVTQEPRYDARMSEALGLDIHSMLCVPIRRRDTVVGAFEVVNRLDGAPFDASDLPLLAALASLVGIVLDNSHNWRTAEQLNRDLEDLVRAKTREIEAANRTLTLKTQRLALTTKTISLINSNRNMREIFLSVAEHVRKLVCVDYLTIALIDNATELTLLELFPQAHKLELEGIKIPFEDPILRYVVRYKRSVFHARDRWYQFFLEEGRFVEHRLGTMLCIPIMAAEIVVGTLNLGCLEKHRYEQEVIDIITFLAKQLGVALEREKLHQTLETVNQELNEKAFALRKQIMTMGDANLKLFDMQRQLREKDLELNRLLSQVQEKNQELQATLAELKQTQTHLVQSEKMASLGQLVAGIAHELNTPAGAIKAASEIIPDYMQKTLEHYEQLLTLELSPEHHHVLGELVAAMVKTIKERERKSTAEIRDQTKQLTERLQEHDIPQSRLLAKDIARCYLEEHVETLIDLFRVAPPRLVMDFFTHCSRILVSSRDNQLSIETISRIVRALKSYSYLDQSQERQVDLNEDIENTLTILHSHIPTHIRIVKKFGILPKISCLGSELNQVWTNLLQNALQALGEKEGTITIETSTNSQHVVVRITDTGPGIPKEIQGKIFDPFFTTYRGKASGLGLSITHQVVEKHKGAIRVESTTGRTVFEVSLPKQGVVFRDLEGTESITPPGTRGFQA
ncbi:GAF domain-containing protein [candidate division KSB3 bacterium]|uniref:histidine kinase n=1 Tax=candidate division KSB3 bacterium TaxID=2044937 RepID=A0A9D5JVH6_9BACT|nr:GAF domain-containing protein [candidate division KSB3 bacterium]MBD3325028.1 GAF domain-containing protein [candidate division KSB3 bacterium]